jgi:hypothetical protein
LALFVRPQITASRESLVAVLMVLALIGLLLLWFFFLRDR